MGSRALFAVGLALLTGCAKDNPRYCRADLDCAARSGSKAPYCHPKKHFCYAGCQGDADCLDASRRMYVPGDTICDLRSHHCKSETSALDAALDAGARDSVADQLVDLELGKRCTDQSQCKSGQCVDDVCCETSCTDTCYSCALAGLKGRCRAAREIDPRGDCRGDGSACAGKCDGKGSCAFAGSERVCGRATCDDRAQDQLVERRCDGKGRCENAPTTCGGLVCKDQQACRSSCASSADCLPSFVCDGALKQCQSDLPRGAACGKNGAACNSGKCADGVCCDALSCGVCQRCNLNNSQGTCSAYGGVAATGECPGDAICGAGRCSAGACAYAQANKSCGEVCVAGQETISRCGAGKCVASGPMACAPHLCDAAGKVCRTGCISHADCVAGGLCDRTRAHLSGQGRCVAPAKIATVKSGANLQLAVDAAVKAGMSHLRLEAGSYGAVSISSGDLTLIGVQRVTVSPKSGGHGITVSGGARLALQQITVQGATSGDGVRCRGAGATKSRLVVIESDISKNPGGRGVDTVDCDVIIRRSRIQGNSGGGLTSSNGAVELVNALITNNGAVGTGGAQLVNLKARSIIFNDTIAKNVAGTGGVSGVTCNNVLVKLTNQIVWENVGGAKQSQGCIFASSDLPGGKGSNIDLDPRFTSSATGDFTLKKKPTPSPGIDRGASTAGVSVLDITGGPRKVNAAPDLGAFEAK